jgi:hypothetical protein
MRGFINHAIIIVSGLSLLSCTEPIEVSADLPDRGKMITIIGLFGADSAWQVDITSSKAILDTKMYYGLGAIDLEPITNAQVVVRENGGPHDNLVYSPKTFITESWSYRSSQADIHPVPGKTYDIEVTVPGVGNATASSFVPAQVKILSAVAGTELTTVTTRRINGSSNEPTGYRAVQAEVVIDDPAGENYYEIIVKYQRLNESAPMPWWAAAVYTKDMRYHNTGLTPGGSVIQGSNDEYYSVIFSDSGEEAKELKLSMMMPVQTNISEDGMESIREEVANLLVLRTLSKEYFQYVASQELQAFSHDDPFAQPVVVYGNVKGGLGIFAGYSEDSKVVDFK